MKPAIKRALLAEQEELRLATSKVGVLAGTMRNTISSLYAEAVMLNSTLLDLFASLDSVEALKLRSKKKVGKSKRSSGRKS